MTTSLTTPTPNRNLTPAQCDTTDVMRTMRLLAPLTPGIRATEPAHLIPFALAYAERYAGDIPQVELASQLLLAAQVQAYTQADNRTTVRLTEALLPLCGRLSLLDSAEPILQVGIEACQQLSDEAHLARFQNRLGGLLYLGGRFREGWQLWHDGLRAATAMGQLPPIWEPYASFVYLVEVAGQSDEVGALLSAWEAEHLACFTVALFAQGFLARHQGQMERSKEDLMHCLHLLAQQDSTPTGQVQLFRVAAQAEFARAHGELAQAREATEAALMLAALYGDFYTALVLLIDHGLYCWRHGHPEEARATVTRLTRMLSEATESPWLAQIRSQVARIAAAIMPRALPAPMATMSARERDVLRLVAEGCSNQEVAEQLIISAATVKKHLEHIYAKLGAHNRTAAVARARTLAVIS